MSVKSNVFSAISELSNKCDTCHKVGAGAIGGIDKDKGMACEECHGPASNHIKLPSSKNITNPRYLTAAEQTAICDKCHNVNNNSSVLGYVYHTGTAYWAGSKHNLTSVMSCSTCHDSHRLNNDNPKSSLKAEYNSLCASCHLKTFDINLISTGQDAGDVTGIVYSLSHNFK
jgi:predicted CXXCH cytochrome family protein